MKIKIKKLSDLSENFDHIRVPLSSKQRQNLEKIYPYYGAQNVIDYVDDFLFDGEYLLVAEDGANLVGQNANVCNIATGKFWVNNHAHILKGKEGNLTKYLYYYLNLLDFKPFVTGSAQPKLTKENLGSIPVNVHSPIEQEKIVQILDFLDRKIQLNNKINAEIEALAKLIYDYWFVQFDFPDENGKPYKSSGGKMVWNEELKKDIPEKWIVKKVADFLDVVTGKEDADFASDGGKYAYFTCGRKVLKCNDAVFSGKSVLIAGNGSFDVKYYNGKFNAYQRVYVLKPRDEKFIGIIYRSVVRNISRFTLGSQGSIVKFITKGDVENISILVPDNLELLTQLNSILDMTQRNDFESEQLASLRDWLLPMLMNGQAKIV